MFDKTPIGDLLVFRPKSITLDMHSSESPGSSARVSRFSGRVSISVSNRPTLGNEGPSDLCNVLHRHTAATAPDSLAGRRVPRQTRTPPMLRRTASLPAALAAATLLASCVSDGGGPPPQPSAEAGAQHIAFVVPEGHALVTVYRPSALTGGLRSHRILINGRHVATMRENTRHSQPVPPGPVTVEAVWFPYSPKLAFTAEAGAAYFIKLSPNILDAGPKLGHAEPGAAAAAAGMTPVGR